MRTKSGIFIGKNAGHKIAKPEENPKKLRPSYRKGKLGERTDLVRSVIKELGGFTPYESKAMRFITTGDEKAMKRAGKFLKKRIGTYRRARIKIEYLTNVVAAQKKAAKEQAAKEKAEREAKEKAEKEAQNKQ